MANDLTPHRESEDLYRSRVTAHHANPKGMKKEEVRHEIESLCETMNLAAQRIQELSRFLYEHSRRSGAWDSTTSAYISYSNAWGRFAAAIQQGIRRTSVVTRTLDQVIKNQTLSAPIERKSPEVKKQKSQPASVFSGPFEDGAIKDLIDLYSLET